MNKARKIRQELENFLTDNAITLEFGTGGFYGGGCLVHSESRIVVNKNIPVEEQITIIARSIIELDLKLERLKPTSRSFVEEFSNLRKAE